MHSKLRASITAVVATLFILVAAQAALAGPITFNTTGVFNNIPAGSGCTGNGTNQLICNDGRQITFVGTTNGSFNSPIGTFQYTNIAASTAVGPIIPAGITFTLTINQLVPTPGTGTFVGTFLVEANGVASFNVLRFDRHTLRIGEVPYYMVDIHVPGANLFGGVDPIPEPGTMLLLGTGLAGVVGAVRKRRKTDQQE